MHGGNTPAAKFKAQQALALARMPAIEALHSIIEQFLEKTCGACGYPSGDTDEQRSVIAAAKITLDRTEMGPTLKHQITSSSTADLNLDLLTTEEKAELIGLLARVKEIKAILRHRQFPNDTDTPVSAQPTTVQ
jgi:hypothetical protein